MKFEHEKSGKTNFLKFETKTKTISQTSVKIIPL